MKSWDVVRGIKLLASLPSRGARVEINKHPNDKHYHHVAPLAGSEG